ncbi:MAG: hypothetical protein O7E52_09075 [Candidatus Poribacteria bacterium]|nr:hypothetical protein [Candidatus Poribacteria bacterium]
MADGCARASLGPGIAMAQSVGAANLAAELQSALIRALAAAKPAVVDVVSDIDAFAPGAYVPE